MILNYSKINDLGVSGAYGGTRELDGLTSAFLMSLLALWPSFTFAWEDSGEYWDEIEDMVAKSIAQVSTDVDGGNGLLTGFIYPAALDSAPATEGFLPCTGQLYLIADYPLLAGVLAQNFIENATQFRTPDLRGRVPMGDGTGWQLSPRTAGQYLGEEEHELTEIELAQHSHVYRGDSAFSPEATSEYRMTSKSTYWQELDTETTGRGDGHNNIQPSCVINYWIYTEDRP